MAEADHLIVPLHAKRYLGRAGSGLVRELVLESVLRNGLQPLLSGADFSIERYDRRQFLRYIIAVFQDY